MKKILTAVLVLMMALSLAACGSKNDKKTNSENDTTPKTSSDDKGSSVDMSKYPSNMNEWSGQNFIDYFKAAGVFTEGNGFETWLQDHATYWPEMPVSECAGWWNEEGTVTVMIFLFDDSLADSSKEQYDEWMKSIKEKKTLPGELSVITVDHLIGNVGFIYEATVLDDAIYDKVDAAYKSLVSALKVTPEF